MDYHLYLSLMPEALIASMLNPEDFASYYALGGHGKTQGQAVFIELDPEFRSDFLPVEEGLVRCVPHSDGNPKRSVYISIYQVLEHVPASAMRDLYFVTKDGHALRVSPIVSTVNESGLHYYQELAPVRPAVVSTLGPGDFFAFLMDSSEGFKGLPAIAFVELRLGELSLNPEKGSSHDLPYENMEHLRMCLSEIKTKKVTSKILDRNSSGLFLYRMVRNGIFVGSQKEGLFLYGMPPSAQLREKYYSWWRSANM